jgi:hypothetical protein
VRIETAEAYAPFSGKGKVARQGSAGAKGKALGGKVCR